MTPRPVSPAEKHTQARFIFAVLVMWALIGMGTLISLIWIILGA